MELYRTAGHLIRRCHQIDSSIFSDETSGYDITSPQWAALRILSDHPGIEMTRLSDLIAYDRSTIGALVERLVAKGLVSRIRGTIDRRTRELTLTDAGTALVNELMPQLYRVQDRLLASLSEAEQEHFISLLERVVADNDEVSRPPQRLPAMDVA
jgi:MarR family transcriptional regulator, temperature-dependent positive regulator of motility